MAKPEWLHIPEADSSVFTTGREAALLVGIPVETEALFLVTVKLDLGSWGACWVEAVLCAVEDQDPAVDGECRNDIGVLGLVAGLVHLARVIDLLGDLETDGRRLPRRCLASIAANLT